MSEVNMFEASVAQTVYSINMKNTMEREFLRVAMLYEQTVNYIKNQAKEIEEYINANPNYHYDALFTPIEEGGEQILHVDVWKDSPFQHGFDAGLASHDRFYITVCKRTDERLIELAGGLENYLLNQVRRQLGYNMVDAKRYTY